MKRLLILSLIPLTLWGDYLFVLFDAGERVALAPVIEALEERAQKVKVIAYTPGERYRVVAQEELSDADVVVTGVASKIQLQYIQNSKGKTVAYYDNPLPIETISYAPLIREFEKEVDLFLVPSEAAAASSIAEKVEVVGNPDLDRYQASEEKKGVVTYFGGYDPDYPQAFQAFLDYIVPLGYEVVIRPHPSTDGKLEESLIAPFPSVRMGDSRLSSAEAVANSEIVACHRSSMAIKGACAGKKVVCIDAEGNITAPPSRSELGIPSGATERILHFLQ